MAKNNDAKLTAKELMKRDILQGESFEKACIMDNIENELVTLKGGLNMACDYHQEGSHAGFYISLKQSLDKIEEHVNLLRTAD